jgi:hypothetical protein
MKGRKWGFQADSKVTSCAWTKLLLDNSSENQEFDDPLLRQATGSGIFHMPAHRDPQGVCEEFLREIYLHTTEHLKIKIGREIFDITPMDCWLTLPATWSDRAKAATKSAAEKAGFGSRAFDRLYTITEPEAAALATLKQYEAGKGLYPIKVSYSLPIFLLSVCIHLAFSLMRRQAGDNILVCDCGGGTVDITTYAVFTTDPLQFEELCEGIGM